MELGALTLMKRMQHPLPSPPHADSGELVLGWVKKAEEQWER